MASLLNLGLPLPELNQNTKPDFFRRICDCLRRNTTSRTSIRIRNNCHSCFASRPASARLPKMRLSFAFFLSLIALVAGDSATCGTVQYNSDALSKASDAGCSLVKKGSTIGRNKYPHEYKNFEKIKLSGSGPYYEFPVLSNGQVYSGGKL